METYLVIALVVFLAAFTQSLTGFGSALVAMAVLPEVIGLRVAAPVVALVAAAIEVVLLVRYRRAIDVRAIAPLLAALIAGIPLGILAAQAAPQNVALIALGLLIAAYSLYGWFTPELPRLDHPAWAYGFGLVAGVLGGAYNTSGPPVVIFANCRRWSPDAFKGNLQGFFLIGDVLVIAGHALGRNVTPEVLADFAIAVPALGAGLLAGGLLDRRLNPDAFRKVVLVVLFIMGLRLLVG